METPPRIPPVIRPPPLPSSRPPPAAGRSRQELLESLVNRLPALRSGGPPPGSPILTPAELDRFKNLLLFARSTVEGYFSGKHKSPMRGASAEFADFREYTLGDDVARLDWRVYGRSRRLFLRQYHEETDMVMYLLVDTSASMSYAGARRQSKYLLAAKVAAALAYLMIHQGDKAALALFADTVSRLLGPGGTRRHLHQIVTELERVQPAAGTGMAQALTECARVFKKRGCLVVLSDFLTDHEALFDALGQFQHRKFELLLLHFVDPDELLLPSVNVAKFEDLETAEQVQVEPEEIRAAYRATMRQIIENLAQAADQRRMSYALVRTDQPYLDALEAYLGFRGRNAWWTT